MPPAPPNVGIAELRADMRTIIDRVLNGDTFTITDYKHPAALLVPVAQNDRYTITDHNGLNALYCIPCGAIIGNAHGPVSTLLAAIGTHDTLNHTEEQQ